MDRSAGMEARLGLFRSIIHFKLLIGLILFVTSVQAQASDDEEPLKVGNFALQSSQQPGAFFGFGGNIIDQGEVQCSFFIDEFVGKYKTVIDVYPSILYGVTDDLSIFLNFPFTPLTNERCSQSKGWEDWFIQGEYAFYSHSTYTYCDQATLVANVSVPTGKKCSTGFGSPSFLLGMTYSHMLVDWFFLTAQGVVLTTSRDGTKCGDQFLYEFGIGRNLPSPKGWIYAWLLELDGQYSKKNRMSGELDSCSGGNVIYATPSLWFSNDKIIIQFGFSLPIVQKLRSKHDKFDYALNFNFSWTFD